MVTPELLNADHYHYMVGGVRSSIAEPFEYNGYLYMFGTGGDVDTPAANIHAMTKAVGGNTWVELDAAHAPDCPGVVAGFGDAFSLALDGSTVQIVQAKYAGAGTTTCTPCTVTFNLATGEWGTVVEHAAPVMYPCTGIAHTQFALIRRLTGSFILFYQGPKDTVYNRCYYSTFNGTAFGAETIVPNQPAADGPWPIGGATDSNGDTHLLMWSSTRAAYVITMAAAGTFSALRTVLGAGEDYTAAYGSSSLSIPKVITLGGVETVAFLASGIDEEFTSYPVLLCSAPVADTSTWTVTVVADGGEDELVPDRGDNWPLWRPLSVAQSSNGNLYAVWTHTLEDGETGQYTGEFWESHSSDGLAWSAHALLFDCGTQIDEHGWVAEQAYAIPVTGGIGVFGICGDAVGDESGGPYCQAQYGLIDISGPPSIVLTPGTPAVVTVNQVGAGNIILTPGKPSVAPTTCPPSFTLMRVCVSMKPATHLPVRGR